MKKLTNHATGPRGINLKGKGTHWLEPGDTLEVDAKDIVGALPDLGKKADEVAASEATDVAGLRAEVAALTKQVEDLTKAGAESEKKLKEATDANAALTKQVEDLTKAGGK